MGISTYIVTLNDGTEFVLKLFKDNYSFNEAALKLVKEAIDSYFDKIHNDCYLLVEYPYVDKVYRDSYYHYFSTKPNQYKRDCIRISFFNGEIKSEDFRNSDRKDKLAKKFLGFTILRPDEPHIIGRNVISPKALKNNQFVSCQTEIKTSANGIKLSVNGFPHSSQDEETISCAETTIWSLMEYFSNKYPEYRPVLPSKIISTLNSVTSERQLPSKGLNILQMSFALRDYGFGTRIYSREVYGIDFEKLISCYIDSGIPLIIAIDNRHAGKIGHALVCIGHNEVNDQDIDSLKLTELSNVNLKNELLKKGIYYFDWHDIRKKFIFIDDNYPPYQEAFLDAPARHYKNAAWHNCAVNYFIAPLYTKIYLEAFVAKAYVNNFLILGPVPIADNSELLIKFFLASSRSYKNYIALENSFQSDIKNEIIVTPMPKFIWIAELSNKTLIKQGLANGIVILDSTEANTNNNKPLIYAAFQDKVITYDVESNKHKEKVLPLQPFRIYTNNLRKN